MMEQKKLFLLDAYALIYRAYFGFANNHRINSKGLNTSAILGFTNTLMEVLKKEKPSHLAVVFDTASPTVRHQEFADYKANREEVPDDIVKALPYIQQLLDGLNITMLSSDGYEADDVIGTVAKKAELEGYITYMMTPDKDFGQLVSEKVLIYKPARLGNSAEVMGPAEVCKRFEISETKQVIDILGLMGDKVDNIPGIPGVGEKTAIQLIKEFGSIENLLQNTDKLKGKLKEKVEQNKQMAIDSKKLATIICNVPLEFNLDHLKLKEYKKDQLRELFNELEFRRLGQQILGEDIAPQPQQGDLFSDVRINVPQEEIAPKNFSNIGTVPHKYYIADTLETRKKLIEKLQSSEQFAFDTETTSLEVINAEIVGMSFSVKPHEAYYVPVTTGMDGWDIVQEFKPLLEDESKVKIGQNIKYDLLVLKNYGVELKGKMFDTMIAHFLIKPEMRHNMNVLSETYLNYSPVDIESLIGKKGKGQLSMRDVPLPLIADYAAEDADVTIQLKNVFEPMLDNEGIQKLFKEVEVPLVPVLSAMESEGINLDTAALKEISSLLEKDIIELEKDIQQTAGTSFNVSSPSQVGKILFDVLKIIDKPKKTKTGQYATGEDILSKLTGKHPIIEKILNYRELVKLKNTYVDTLPEMVNPKTGRVHTSYNQVVAVTGRLSSDNPNLQNIPIRTERGREIRKAFIPRSEEYTLLSADYSQIELRIIAALSEDEGMLEAFCNGLDIHSATASKVYNVPLEEVTSDMRRNAKMVNFGIIYGISAFGLSERLNIPRKEASTIIEQYFLKYPGIKRYMSQSVENAREKGYVETVLGRKRHLRDIHSTNAVVRGFAERNAINAPIQGSAADMIKIAMIRIHDKIKSNNMKSRMLLQVHDELVFDAHLSEVEQLKEIVQHEMKNAISLKVPVEVGMGTGKNWLEAH